MYVNTSCPARVGKAAVSGKSRTGHPRFQSANHLQLMYVQTSNVSPMLNCLDVLYRLPRFSFLMRWHGATYTKYQYKPAIATLLPSYFASVYYIVPSFPSLAPLKVEWRPVQLPLLRITCRYQLRLLTSASPNLIYFLLRVVLL